MYVTLQRRTSLWLCLEKRIVGIENVVEKEEYNKFDEIPSFDTLHTSPNSWELTKHHTCEATIVKKSIKEEKANLISAESFLMSEDVSIAGNRIRC
jgi:hypothetical protein